MATSCNSKKRQEQKGGIRLANLDQTANPRDDFYQYAWGGWMKANPLTDEYSRFGSFDQLAENNRTQIKSLIEEPGETTRLNREVSPRKWVICII